SVHAEPRLAVGADAQLRRVRAWARGEDLAGAARGALRACFAQLRASGGAAPDCGCRVIAAGDALLGEAEDFAYATGVSARLISADLDLDLDATAREDTAPQGGRRLLLSPVPGPDPAELRIGADGEARLSMDGQVWRGRRLADGLSRGRFRERAYLEREDGARLTVMAGWPPVAFALARRELLRWPVE
ncbi:MAG: hypothetical protein ACQEUZ_00290, partial [Pseudomonadota bacterium]